GHSVREPRWSKSAARWLRRRASAVSGSLVEEARQRRLETTRTSRRQRWFRDGRRTTSSTTGAAPVARPPQPTAPRRNTASSATRTTIPRWRTGLAQQMRRMAAYARVMRLPPIRLPRTVVRFAGVGVANTAIDVVLFWVLQAPLGILWANFV